LRAGPKPQIWFAPFYTTAHVLASGFSVPQPIGGEKQ
jgi:hypothetical protein